MISRTAETPAPNRWPRGSIIRALGRRAAASAGMADGIGGSPVGRRASAAAYQTNPTSLVGIAENTRQAAADAERYPPTTSGRRYGPVEQTSPSASTGCRRPSSWIRYRWWTTVAPAETIALTGQYFVADSSMQRRIAVSERSDAPDLVRDGHLGQHLRVLVALVADRVDLVALDRLALLGRDRDDVHRRARRERRDDRLDRATARSSRLDRRTRAIGPCPVRRRTASRPRRTTSATRSRVMPGRPG